MTDLFVLDVAEQQDGGEDAEDAALRLAREADQLHRLLEAQELVRLVHRVAVDPLQLVAAALKETQTRRSDYSRDNFILVKRNKNSEARDGIACSFTIKDKT